MRHPDVSHANTTVVRRHVEGPKHFFNFEAFAIRWGQKRRDAIAITGLATGTGKNQIVLGFVNTGIPSLRAVDNPLIAVTNRRGFHMRRIGAVVGLGYTEGKACAALRQIVYPRGFLFLGTVFDHQQQAHVVAHDGVLVL